MQEELQSVVGVCGRIEKFSNLYHDIIKEAPSVQNDLKTKYIQFLNSKISELQSLATTITNLP